GAGRLPGRAVPRADWRNARDDDNLATTRCPAAPPRPGAAGLRGGRGNAGADKEEVMRRIGPNSFTEIYFAGCNPGFVETSDGYVMIDSPQQPIDAVRWREQLEEKAAIRYLINTEPHGDHISGNAYFTKTTVVGQVQLQECFDRYLNAFGSLDDKRERYKQMDPDSVWLVGHPDYPASNPPTLTFTDTLTLNVGYHTFNILHHPGHTAP